MPLDWNKINEEDSSVSGYQSTHEEQFQIPTPKITKNLSDPGLTLKKLKSKASINDVSDSNLQKLQALETSQVWLFIPKSSKRDDPQETQQNIKQLKNIKKTIKNTGGWNILVSSKQQAKKLIEDGYRKNKISLRFYVSTKNYDVKSTSPQRTKKSSGSSSKFYEDAKYYSPRKQKNGKLEQQSKKKKSRYLEKKTQINLLNTQVVEGQEKNTEKKTAQLQKLKQNEQQLEDMNNIQQIKNQTIQKSDQLDKINSQSVMLQSAQQQFQNLQNSNQEETLNLESTCNQRQDIPQTNQKSQFQNKEQNIDGPLEQQYDSQQSLQRMKRALKRKNKKLNKKKTTTYSQNYTDQNNPFSLLSN